MSEEGTGGETTATDAGSWLDGVDESLRSDPSLANIGNVNDLAKQHVEAQGLIGRKGVIIPKEGDAESVFERYRQEMGVPGSSEDYTLEGFSQPEGLELDGTFLEGMRNVALKSNLSDKAFTDLLQGYSDIAAEMTTAQAVEAQQAVEERDRALKTEWGSAYNAKTDLAGTALSQMTEGNPQSVTQIQLLDGTLLGDHPDFMRVMAEVGGNLQEKGLLGEKQVHLGVTPEQARSEMEVLEADPAYLQALLDDQHPGHAVAVEKRQRLHELAFPPNS